MGDESYGVERNIIFLFPITPNLQELKNELEKDSNYSVFEVDSLQEYAQLAGVTPGAITFCSDLVKTQRAFETHEKLLRSAHGKFILCSEKKVSPLDFLNLQKKGLHEQIASNLSQKAIIYKIDLIFRAQESKAKNAQQKKINTQEKMRVEKGIVIENTSAGNNEVKKLEQQKKDDQKGKMQDYSGYGEDLTALAGNFNITGTMNEQQKSLGGHYKHQSMSLTDLSNGAEPPQFKKYVNPYLDNNDGPTKKRANFFEQLSDYNQRKITPLVQVEQEGKKPRTQLDDYWNESAKKKKKLEEVEADWQLKNGNLGIVPPLEERPRDYQDPFANNDPLSRPKDLVEQQEADLSKRKKLDELSPGDLAKDDSPQDDILNEILSNTTKLEEVARDNPKKDGRLEDLSGGLQLKRKPLTLQEEIDASLADLMTGEPANQDNDKESLNEIDSEGKKKKSFEEIDSEWQRKKGLLNNVENDGSKKRPDLGSLDEFGRPRNNLESIDLDKEKQKTLEEVDFDLKQKKLKDVDFNNEKKRNAFQEQDLSGFWGSKKLKADARTKEKKVQLEETLDYGWAKKVFGDGDLILPVLPEQVDEYQFEKALIDEELEVDVYYPPSDLYAIYLVYLTQFIYEEQSAIDKSSKFIQFILGKSNLGYVSFYRTMQGQEGEKYHEVYSGHRGAKDWVLSTFESSWETVIDQWWKTWADIKTPWWSDSTWQDEFQTFVFPYYEGSRRLGFAVGHFEKSIHSELDAKNVELLMASLRTYFLDETKG